VHSFSVNEKDYGLTRACIVGMACKFSCSADLNLLWATMSLGHDTVVFSDNLNIWASCVEDRDVFDAEFFSVTPREACVLDPQHRWVLECAWWCIEDATRDPLSLNGQNMSVHVGIQASEFGSFLASCGKEKDLFLATGSSLSTAAGRISYILGVTGECLSIDTACSSGGRSLPPQWRCCFSARS
jgi:acyl transferase domain-containing protein